MHRIFHALMMITTGSLLTFSLLLEKWSWMKIPVMLPRFADLRMITSTADCIKGGGWTIYSETCDIYGRPYNYPIIWARLFSIVGLGENSTEILGIAFGIFVIAVFVYLVRLATLYNCSYFQISIVCMTAVSPPVFLLIERGNTDSLIIVLIVASAFFYEKKPTLSALLSSIAVGLKIFPALVSLKFLEKRKNIGALCLYVTASALMLWPTIKFLDLITQRTGQNRNFSFGATSTLSMFFPNALNMKGLYILPINLVITVIFSLIAFLILEQRLYDSISVFKEKSFESSLFGFSGLTFVGTYLSGTRFDYSLSVLVPFVASIAISKHKDKILWCLQGLVLIAMWLSFRFEIDNMFADMAASLVVIVFISICFVKLKLIWKNSFSLK